jgi:hypothetical protein
VQPIVEVGQGPDVVREQPRVPGKVLAHGRPVDPLEHERIGSDFVDARDRKAARPGKLHDRRLAPRTAADPQDRPVAEIDDLRRPPLADHRQGCVRITTS